MKNLKLINYKSHRGHDGCTAFNADLVYNGKKIAHVYDDAMGGEYQYTTLGKWGSDEYMVNYKTLKGLIGKAKQLPKVKTEYGEINNCIDFIIDDLAKVWEIKKDEKKGVIVKRHSSWQIIGFKTSIPTTIKKWSDGLDAIQKVYDEQKQKGAEILNTEYLQSVGINL